MDPRFYSIEYLDWLVMTGRAGIWFSDNAALVCEIKVYPTGARAVAVVIAAGDKNEIVNELRPAAEAWGKDNGCTFSMVESREGWGHALKTHGYEAFQRALVKEL